jgi:hypothetical protein
LYICSIVSCRRELDTYIGFFHFTLTSAVFMFDRSY